MAGAFLGGAATYSLTNNYHYGSGGGYYNDTDTSITTNFVWWGGAEQSTIVNDRNANRGGTVLWTSTFTRNTNGRVTQVAIADGRPRTVYYINDAQGQVMKRWETSSASTNPIDNAFYFNGRRVGETSNNGPTEQDYSLVIAARDDDGRKGDTYFSSSETTNALGFPGLTPSP